MTASSTSIPTEAFEPDDGGAVGSRGLTLSDLAERRLIDAAKGGDEDAFRALVEQNADSVYRFSLRLLGCREDALDVSQEVFIRAHRALPRFQWGRARLSTWLFQIALNRCRDRFKSSAVKLAERCVPISASEKQVCSEMAGPDEIAQWCDDGLKLRRGLAAISKRHAEILALAYLEELSHSECAEILRCSVRGIEGRLYRARQVLQAWWDAEPG